MKEAKVKVKKQIKETKLGTILREARDKKGLNVTKVAIMLNVSQPYLSYIEKGRIKSPDARLLYKLSLLYKLKIKDLILAIED
ncbi:MAG TPA: helix-turn-helix transcriptional regulator [Saprospiraceae bacterium]|nr:helix-turn-helix transcriptional regulator [Saprospiraceae bacterium]